MEWNVWRYMLGYWLRFGIVAAIIMWGLVALFSSEAFGEITPQTANLIHENRPTRDSNQMITQFQTWVHSNGMQEKINLLSYSRSSGRGRNRRPCGCSMCKVINYGWIAAYNEEQETGVSTWRPLKEGEVARNASESLAHAALGTTPEVIMDEGIRLADIGPHDIVGELGCGIAEWCVRAVEAGAKRAYGFEIEYDMYKSAQKHVRDAVVQGRIAPGTVFIHHKNVKNVDLQKYGVTIVLMFLYEKLLDELAQKGAFTGVDKVVSRKHYVELPDMTEGEFGELFLYTDDPDDQPVRSSRLQFKPLAVAATKPDTTPDVAKPQEAFTEVDPDEVAISNMPKKRRLALLAYLPDWFSCGACNQWKSNEQSKVNEAVVVRPTQSEAAVAGISSYPSFRIGVWNEAAEDWVFINENGSHIGHNGYWSATKINAVTADLLRRYNGDEAPEQKAAPAKTQQKTQPQRRRRRGFFSNVFSGVGGTVSPKAATVRVHIRTGGNGDAGTGTVIHTDVGESHVLTCSHTFRRYAEVSVYDFNTQQEYPASIVKRVTTPTDLCVLKVQAELPSVSIASTQPVVGATLTSMGCDNAGPIIPSDCELQEIDPFTGPSSLICTGRHVVGRSGGGLFNANNELVGVCTGKFTPALGLFTGGKEIRSLVGSVGLSL